MPSKNKLGRQDFLKLGIAAVGATIGLGIGVPAVSYVVGPALKKAEEQNWIQLGAVAKIPLGVPTLFKFKITSQTGWIVDEREISVYILSDDGREFVAISNICTHLGCRVRWIDNTEEFFCPCHNGVFDKQGNVLAGPPPRPLDHYQVKVEDGQLFILGG
jgi:menaquinol-cytochrome c reductase iron-sulfur subunit